MRISVLGWSVGRSLGSYGAWRRAGSTGDWGLGAGRWLRVAGCWWLVAGCWLLVAGCWLLVAGCWLLVAGCWLLVAGCWLLVAGCWLLVAGCHRQCDRSASLSCDRRLDCATFSARRVVEIARENV